jgi:ferredoxin
MTEFPFRGEGELDEVTITIDHDRCVGVGRCEEIEPDVVELRSDGWSYPRTGARIPRRRAEQLCAECPSEAISILS